MRRTKIVATVGPATRDPDVLTRVIEAGADVLRVNFSHGDPEDHKRTILGAREAAVRAGREVGLMGDLPGPKMRVGDIAGDVVELPEGGTVTLTPERVDGDATRLPVAFERIADLVSTGDPVFMADGRIRLRVAEVVGSEVRCEIEVGGALASHQGVNLPGSEPTTEVREGDLDWVDFAVEQGIDLLAVSFVLAARDLERVSRRLEEREADIPLIAKIEKPQAAQRAAEIVEACTGGIMVARGDLGIELPLAQVPVVQKHLLGLAGKRSKPSITATQMLASMVTSNRPTRAEVTDVANAIYDGTDAVMLSEETAIGEHPVEAVQVMADIARETEPDLPYGDWLLSRVDPQTEDIADSVARGAVGSAYRLNLAALVVPTRSGRTARLVSAHRPRVPVLAISPRPETVRRLNLLFGVRCAHAEEWEDLHDLLDDCAALARTHGVASSGDLVAITAGLPEQELGTNLFEIHRVP